ncbi:MAG TPA: 4-hydroxy-tetrahydrodipicolinate reductase [Burkholderiales bacterium]|nr:4-hydroxy-tetrahydrodipicolinate reductase [Burkholderiales bacterium]
MSRAGTRIVIAGAGGKMGRTLIESVLADRSLVLAAAFDVRGSAAVGTSIGGIKVGSDAGKAVAAGDVLVDFTRPEGTIEHLAACARLGKPIVIGTTGFPERLTKAILQAGHKIPIAMSPNFAIGVNAVFKLAEAAAKILGDDYDVEIVEAHHRQKVDAPSGTALKLGEIVAKALKRDLAKTAVYGRQGDTGVRPAGQIGFHAIRGGDIVGEHTVIFAGTGERVEVTIRSQSRMTYALGALRAAKFLRGKRAGLYDMNDVLGLK